MLQYKEKSIIQDPSWVKPSVILGACLAIGLVLSGCKADVSVDGATVGDDNKVAGECSNSKLVISFPAGIDLPDGALSLNESDQMRIFLIPKESAARAFKNEIDPFDVSVFPTDGEVSNGKLSVSISDVEPGEYVPYVAIYADSIYALGVLGKESEDDFLEFLNSTEEMSNSELESSLSYLEVGESGCIEDKEDVDLAAFDFTDFISNDEDFTPICIGAYDGSVNIMGNTSSTVPYCVENLVGSGGDDIAGMCSTLGGIFSESYYGCTDWESTLSSGLFFGACYGEVGNMGGDDFTVDTFYAADRTDYCGTKSGSWSAF